MMSLRLRPRWLFSWRTVRALLWAVLLLAVVIAAGMVGLRVFGGIASWERWLADTAGYFFIWRLCLYGVIAYGWRWMRRRLLARDTSADARRRLLRAEVAGVTALIALEISLLLQATE